MLDKTMDLLPVLVILAIVPLLGLQICTALWVVLVLVSVICCSLLFFIVLAILKHNAAIRLLHTLTRTLPNAIAGRVERFATGFVDSLLIGVRRPKVFIPAVTLTGVAVVFDGLFAMLAFWTIGFPIPFGTATFGYLTYNMYHILPTPPGQIGSNEAVGLLVFSGLLHLPALQVTAMFIFSHLWAAALMCATGLACLSALGLTIRSVTQLQAAEKEAAGDDSLLAEGLTEADAE